MWVPKVRYFESTKFIWNAAWRWKQFICPSTWTKTLVCPYSGLPLFSIFESPIIHSVCPSPHPPPKWDDCIFHFLRACENNNLGRIWGQTECIMGYSKIVNGFFASKGPAHGERNMSLRGIMFASSLDLRGDGAGRDNKFSFPFLPYPPTGTIIISMTTDMG